MTLINIYELQDSFPDSLIDDILSVYEEKSKGYEFADKDRTEILDIIAGEINYNYYMYLYGNEDGFDEYFNELIIYEMFPEIDSMGLSFLLKKIFDEKNIKIEEKIKYVTKLSKIIPESIIDNFCYGNYEVKDSVCVDDINSEIHYNVYIDNEIYDECITEREMEDFLADLVKEYRKNNSGK